ncbi:hypothetical protein K469DRAFT_747912 [Zopfia rhizophila CBS 207.26]|uniref:Heterokaryon incompatibility domain-containing protein n=1 Tax=Zopfia rhizophila CBS 207.26 TaxID=1314779 RepID=A0A6A6EDP6_9PEZI|nr:hypothetical protein K469DRAFT_747912 [Zopfia rhizophila CBS 207.26]
MSVFRVTANLLSAWRYLRYSDRARHFWVDAVCINQDDGEKNQQIPMLSSLYSEAKKIVEGTDSAYEQRLVHTSVGGSRNRPGAKCNPLLRTRREGKPQVRRRVFYGNKPNNVGNVSAYAASRLVAATSSVVRKSNCNKVLMNVQSLEYPVSILTLMQATRPADSTYAVLSLGKDVPGNTTVITPSASIYYDDSGRRRGHFDEEEDRPQQFNEGDEKLARAVIAR